MACYDTCDNKKNVMTGTNYAIAVVMGICCFMVIMGAALPWFDYGFGPVSGISGEINSIGVISLIPAVVVTALFVLALITKRWHLLVKIGLILFSVIVALVGIMFVAVVFVEDVGSDAGIGLWMTMWGGIGMVVASIWGSAKWNSAINNSP